MTKNEMKECILILGRKEVEREKRSGSGQPENK